MREDYDPEEYDYYYLDNPPSQDKQVHFELTCANLIFLIFLIFFCVMVFFVLFGNSFS